MEVGQNETGSMLSDTWDVSGANGSFWEARIKITIFTPSGWASRVYFFPRVWKKHTHTHKFDPS